MWFAVRRVYLFFSGISNTSLLQDMETVLPEPFDFWPWVEAHAAELDTGKALNLFEVYCAFPVRVHLCAWRWGRDTLCIMHLESIVPPNMCPC